MNKNRKRPQAQKQRKVNKTSVDMYSTGPRAPRYNRAVEGRMIGGEW